MPWCIIGSDPGGKEVFGTRSDRHRGPFSFLYNGHRVSLPRVKRPERGLDHPPTSSVEVKERIELYLYSRTVMDFSRVNIILAFILPGVQLVIARSSLIPCRVDSNWRIRLHFRGHFAASAITCSTGGTISCVKYLLIYLLTYSLHEAESFLRS